MTYYPAPGHQHIKLLIPPPAARHQQTLQQTLHATRRRQAHLNTEHVSPLVRHAIAVTFGRKHVSTLKAEQFSMAVRNHIKARRRLKLYTGVPQVLSYHQRENGEVFGTISTEDRRYGWVAKLAEDKLLSFKVL